MWGTSILPVSGDLDMISTQHFVVDPSETLETIHESGCLYLKARKYFQAGRLFEECLRREPDHLRSLVKFALVLQMTGRIHLALTTYRKALKLSPNDSVVLNGMGNCYRAEGKFDKAATSYRRALNANPENAAAIYNLTLLDSSPPVRELERLYASSSCSNHARSLVCFALGRINEGQGEFHRAFRFYEEANALQFALAEYNEKCYAALFEGIEGTFTSDLFCRLLGRVGRHTDSTPIFVLGMPRSGTSLVEQILASHSLVYGAGEVSVMPWMVENLMAHNLGVSFPSGVATMDFSAFGTIADAYRKQLSTYCADRAGRIVDKTPNNFFLVGLIRLLFPNAPIVHCVRDPMGTCWSMFREYFGGGHGYCYNQSALGRYWRRYRHLMDHWHKVLPGEIHDVKYENLVEHPENTIRSLLEYCRLPWEDKCLAFYDTKRVVNTASFLQVRRPIYKTSIGSWMPVAQELAPLREALEGR
jgi:tetratricopeptide (TPR) repeat protein